MTVMFRLCIFLLMPALLAPGCTRNREADSAVQGEKKANEPGTGAIAMPLARIVPGIDEPLSVEAGDIQLQLTTATKKDTYSANPGDEYRPQSETDIFLVVEAKILSGNLEKVGRMVVSIIDENGRETTCGINTVYNNRSTVVWPIAVARSSQSFTLHLPNNHRITLDSLLSSVRRP